MKDEKTHFVFNLIGDDTFDKNIKRWLRKRNGAVLFRSPLVCEYTVVSRASVLSSQNEIPDLRGF